MACKSPPLCTLLVRCVRVFSGISIVSICFCFCLLVPIFVYVLLPFCGATLSLEKLLKLCWSCGDQRGYESVRVQSEPKSKTWHVAVAASGSGRRANDLASKLSADAGKQNVSIGFSSQGSRVPQLTTRRPDSPSFASSCRTAFRTSPPAFDWTILLHWSRLPRRLILEHTNRPVVVFSPGFPGIGRCQSGAETGSRRFGNSE